MWCNADVRVASLIFSLIFSLLFLTACHRTPSALDRLHPCKIDEGPSEAFCGKYNVFEDRSSQAGRQIGLKVVIAPALKRDPKPDPLFIFAGGPGQGAAKLATFLLPMFRHIQLDRDIVLIDQRGTGDSNPLNCEPDGRDEDDFSKIDSYPIDRFRACLAGYKADPRLYTTSIAMDDIDEVRRYLGYGSINLWGASYGTRAALVYLKRHPDSVRSVVLDAVAPPDMRLGLFAARDVQRAFDLMIEDCAKDQACSKHYPRLRESAAALFAHAEAKPRVTITHPRTGNKVEVTISERLVALLIFHALYDPTLTSLLPQLITDAAQGNYQGLLASAFTGGLPKGSFSDGMFLSVACAEDMPRIQPAEIEREAKGRFLGTAFFDARMKPCEFWPKGAVGEDFYQPVVSDKPVLILSGIDDPITPPTWGDQVAKNLPNAKHILVPGAGHGSTAHGCALELIGKFVDQAGSKDLDSSCLQTQHRPPFFVDHTGVDQP
ncbi:MAG TPA: alpha/beta fold hydrolase [Candidatus Sulfotelmatobacter sp.]|nr:alpha/beta fold hydrolase [Candidatus Sulfotelmatobacter sp.]